MENLTGKQVDRYQILELLGQGGMAMVYKAYDPRLEREVALKIIRLEAFPPDDLQDVRKRFEREAKALAQLSHPNIIKVMDYGEHEGSPFLVMEHLQGGTLKQMIGEPMSWQEAMRLLIPIARGLEYAHRRGIVHRDIKPANILMTEDGEPTLSDFGIVKLFQDEKTALTASGAAVGTPEYMAPEQWTGKTSPKSDIYSLGVVLYEMVTGRRPYDVDTPGELFLKQVTEPLPLPREIVPDLPEPVEQFLLKVLDKEPSERYDDFGAFVRELENLLTEHSLQAKPLQLKVSKSGKVPKANDDRKVPNRRWISIAVLALVMIGIILGGVFGLPPLLSEPENTPEPTSTQTNESIQEPTSTETIAVTAEPSSTPVNISTPNVTATSELGVGSRWVRPADGMVMMYIPAGEFQMGSEYGPKEEQPVHTVYLDAYWLDQTEVTNTMFAGCVDSKICRQPGGNFYWGVSYTDHPVVYVSWSNAKTYCNWAGGRLPTEAEWEKGARGGLVGKLYPWGDESPICLTGAENGAQIFEDSCMGITASVKTFSPNGYGLYDMAGNVSEWVTDWYANRYDSTVSTRNPEGPLTGTAHVVRGGDAYGSDVRVASRASREDGEGGAPMANLGFRCAHDVTQTQVLTPTPLSTDSPILEPDAILIEYGQNVEDSKLPGAPPAVYGFVGSEGDNISMIFVGKGAKGNLLDQSRSILDQFNNVGVNSFTYEYTLPYSGVYYFIILEPDSRDYHYRFAITLESNGSQ
jgi:serine/threonine protein kinase